MPAGVAIISIMRDTLDRILYSNDSLRKMINIVGRKIKPLELAKKKKKKDPAKQSKQKILKSISNIKSISIFEDS
jgi:hypothetical protein